MEDEGSRTRGRSEMRRMELIRCCAIQHPTRVEAEPKGRDEAYGCDRSLRRRSAGWCNLLLHLQQKVATNVETTRSEWALPHSLYVCCRAANHYRRIYAKQLTT